jgi:purine-binding chemotaxis protein CheW
MTNTTETRTQYLSFLLAGEVHAIDILRVREIIEYDVLTRVPSMPPSVRGVINLRGRVVPVVDLAEQFGLAPVAITPRTCIVIVEAGSDDESTVVGIITDAVLEVFDVAESALQPPPAFGTAVAAEYLDGLAETENRKFILLLNVDRALQAVTHARASAPEVAVAV